MILEQPHGKQWITCIPQVCGRLAAKSMINKGALGNSAAAVSMYNDAMAQGTRRV
jgi:hypothetical protein